MSRYSIKPSDIEQTKESNCKSDAINMHNGIGAESVEQKWIALNWHKSINWQIKSKIEK